MHMSPDTMKTVAFVLLLLLVAFYMHLVQAPRREPRSLIDFGRHHHEDPEEADAEPGTDAPAPTTPRRTAARSGR